MAQTHPNAYLAEATAKREQAQQLLQESETLEAKAVELGAELPKPKKKEESDDPSAPDELEPNGPEDATSDDESEESEDENDPHSRHKRGKRR